MGRGAVGGSWERGVSPEKREIYVGGHFLLPSFFGKEFAVGLILSPLNPRPGCDPSFPLGMLAGLARAACDTRARAVGSLPAEGVLQVQPLSG